MNQWFSIVLVGILSFPANSWAIGRTVGQQSTVQTSAQSGSQSCNLAIETAELNQLADDPRIEKVENLLDKIESGSIDSLGEIEVIQFTTGEILKTQEGIGDFLRVSSQLKVLASGGDFEKASETIAKLIAVFDRLKKLSANEGRLLPLIHKMLPILKARALKKTSQQIRYLHSDSKKLEQALRESQVLLAQTKLALAQHQAAVVKSLAFLNKVSEVLKIRIQRDPSLRGQEAFHKIFHNVNENISSLRILQAAADVFGKQIDSSLDSAVQDETQLRKLTTTVLTTGSQVYGVDLSAEPAPLKKVDSKTAASKAREPFWSRKKIEDNISPALGATVALASAATILYMGFDHYTADANKVNPTQGQAATEQSVTTAAGAQSSAATIAQIIGRPLEIGEKVYVQDEYVSGTIVARYPSGNYVVKLSTDKVLSDVARSKIGIADSALELNGVKIDDTVYADFDGEPQEGYVAGVFSDGTYAIRGSGHSVSGKQTLVKLERAQFATSLGAKVEASARQATISKEVLAEGDLGRPLKGGELVYLPMSNDYGYVLGVSQNNHYVIQEKVLYGRPQIFMDVNRKDIALAESGITYQSHKVGETVYGRFASGGGQIIGILANGQYDVLSLDHKHIDKVKPSELAQTAPEKH